MTKIQFLQHYGWYSWRVLLVMTAVVFCAECRADDPPFSVKDALAKGLEHDPGFVPPVGAWQGKLGDHWKATVTLAWLCGVETEAEFNEIWDLYLQRTVFDKAVVDAWVTRFSSISRDAYGTTGGTSDTANFRRVHSVVKKIQRQRSEALKDAATLTMWEWTHARRIQAWQMAVPAPAAPAPAAKIETPGAKLLKNLNAVYGPYQPAAFSELLNERYVHSHKQWRANCVRKRKLDFVETRRLSKVAFEWMETLPNRSTATSEAVAFLGRMFDPSLQRRTPAAKWSDVRTIVRDLDKLIVRLFPQAVGRNLDDVLHDVANQTLAASLDRNLPSYEWHLDLEELRAQRNRLLSFEEKQ